MRCSIGSGHLARCLMRSFYEKLRSVMKKWFFRIIWIPTFIGAVLFLVANRQMVAVSLDPFNAEAPALTTMALPLWAWLMTTLFIGFGAGSAGMWMSGRPHRVEARDAKKTVKELRKEVTSLETLLRQAEGAASDEKAITSVPSTRSPLLESEDA